RRLLPHLRRSRHSDLFPYPTLFRSAGTDVPAFSREALSLLAALPWRRNFDELREVLDVLVRVSAGAGTVGLDDVLGHVPIDRLRSEEHTSELQSRVDLVCGLLLEKR